MMAESPVAPALANGGMSSISAPPISPTPTRTTNHGGYPQAANLPAQPPRPRIFGSPIATKNSARRTLVTHSAMEKIGRASCREREYDDVGGEPVTETVRARPKLP